MDLTIVAARVLLIVGSSCAALIPAQLGSSDDDLTLLSQPVLLPALTEPSPTSDHLATVVLGHSAGMGLDAGVSDSARLDARFLRAEEVAMPPVRVRIASQGIDAPIVPVGISTDGDMETPPGYDQVGWYRFGARPGDPGRAVLAGHLDSRDGPAVFFTLGALQPGDTIEVQFAGGDEAQLFVVRQSAQYPVGSAPLGDIFGPSDRPQLVPITCAGQFQNRETGYSDRVVVYADVVST